MLASSLYDNSVCTVGGTMTTDCFLIDIIIIPTYGDRNIRLDVGRCVHCTIFRIHKVSVSHTGFNFLYLAVW